MNNNLSIDYKKQVLIFVGLPARGKSFTANNLCRFLKWCGYRCSVFNSGDLRRKKLGGFQSSDFFNSDIEENVNIREEISIECFNNLLDWLITDGDIAIFDATNSTKDRREKLQGFSEKKDIDINFIFIELLANDQNIITNNIELKMKSPDYINLDKNVAMKDFITRSHFYTKNYETIENNENINYIKIIKENNRLILNNIYGVTESLITSYLQNLQINKYPIYLSRHGQSEYNVIKKIGGDSNITEDGERYARGLLSFILNDIEYDYNDFVVFTSHLKRTIQTAAHFKCKKIKSRCLNEIYAGICEHLTYNEIEEEYPNIINARKKDKLGYRYPEGESYMDLLERLKYFVLNIECIKSPFLIVGHTAINRVLLAYFMDYNLEDMPHIKINLNEVIKLTPSSTGYTMERIKI